MVVCRPILILFPFFDGGFCDPKSQVSSKLGHGEVHVYSLLPEVLTQRLGCDRVTP